MLSLFEKIMEAHREKPVVSLCQKCMKKFSPKSGADVTNLTDLCFWLFVYGDGDTVLQLVALTHDWVFDYSFNLVWETVHILWALEVYLRRHSGDTAGAHVRRNAILQNLRTPAGTAVTQEEHDARRAKVYNRTIYSEATYQLDIEKAIAMGNKSRLTGWMLSALKRMIGYGEIGLYPDFVSHEAQREADIVQYADILAGRKPVSGSVPDPTLIVEKKLPKKFRDACTLLLTDREQGVTTLQAAAFDTFGHQRDAVMAELAYFDGDFATALPLDMSICRWWGEWHYSNVRTEHVAAMTFAAFRLGEETVLIDFFKEQIVQEQARTKEKAHIIKATVHFYERQIERLSTGYEQAVATAQPCSQLPKEVSVEALTAYTAEGLWRVAACTQVRPMTILGDARFYPLLTTQALREIAAAVNPAAS